MYTKYTKSSIFIHVFTFLVYMLIISSWLCPKCTFMLLYTAKKLSKKVCDVSKGGRSPEERPYDVSRGQYRYVTLS